MKVDNEILGIHSLVKLIPTNEKIKFVRVSDQIAIGPSKSQHFFIAEGAQLRLLDSRIRSSHDAGILAFEENSSVLVCDQSTGLGYVDSTGELITATSEVIEKIHKETCQILGPLVRDVLNTLDINPENYEILYTSLNLLYTQTYWDDLKRFDF